MINVKNPSKLFLLNSPFTQMEQYQNAGKQMTPLISPQDHFMCSQTKTPWFHFDLSLVRLIQGISYPGGFVFKEVKDHTS
ncbi:unnamed protein product [Hymenolepis diminuta]|uniref:Uncharacterized protein n=1 Tax=Hymenolepis diminuta TaxID=6216 RepID=A0A564YL92_HYMDI|nr:unnamed protein product [Hymenolepis diminuta]